ncbi:MAG TPA: hypothetical protein VH561_15325 [Micromonosporaceae bacterium]|jgi:hypothetical protein
MTTPNLSIRTLVATPRLLAAWGLVGYAGLYLAFTFLDWVLPGGGTFGVRSAGAGFTTLVELALPLAGLLFASGAGVASPLKQTRVIATVALIEYAFAVFFGTLAFLIGLGSLGGGSVKAAFDAIGFVVLGLGRLGLAALAGLVVYQAWARVGGVLPVKLVRVRAN